jgi:DNA polymerase-3 subunit delta
MFVGRALRLPKFPHAASDALALPQQDRESRFVPKANAKTTESESRIHAVVGSDESEVKRVAAELAAKLAPPDAGEFGLEVIDACADNVEQAVAKIRLGIEALQTIPFFGGGKLVWLKNANCLADSVIGRSAAVQGALEELAELIEAGLGQDVTLLISATETDKRRSFTRRSRNALRSR